MALGAMIKSIFIAAVYDSQKCNIFNIPCFFELNLI